MLAGDAIPADAHDWGELGKGKSSSWSWRIFASFNPAESRCVWENTTSQSLRVASNSSIRPRSSATPVTTQTLLIMISCWLNWAHPPPSTLECLLCLCQHPAATGTQCLISGWGNTQSVGGKCHLNKSSKAGNPRSERHVEGRLVQIVTQGKVPRG